MPKITEMLDALYEARPPRHSITLTRGQKGIYGWEVKIEGEDLKQLTVKLKQVDSQLRKEFGNSQNGV